MRVLITGATGLVGREIVEKCWEKNWEVHYLSTAQDKLVTTDNYKGFFWDPNSGFIDADCIKGVSAIIHLAGASVSKRWSDSYKEEILQSRIITTQMLIHLLKNHPQHQIKHIISASAIGLYPDDAFKTYQENDNHLNESGFLASVVERWESEVDRFNQLGLLVSKIRIGIVLSENGGALAQMVKPISIGLGAVLGNGNQWMSWIHIEDLAGIFIKLTEDRKEGVYNGVAPNPVTQKQMTYTIAKYLGRKIFLPPVPGFVLKLILGEMASLVLSSVRADAKKIMRTGYRFKFNHLDEALENLLKKQ
ncbi:MAG: TIGR01777 family oxidoreductase [Bacteroidetes bacterium]|nr:TIGR01777 family oxidoreductase [Bacteroidota bacterium]